MSLKGDVDPWAEIERLTTENGELKAEINATHNVLDAAGADSENGLKEITEGPQNVNLKLDARVTRFVISRTCPFLRVRP